MFKALAATAAAVALSFGVAPAANAAGEQAPVSIDIIPGHAMYWKEYGSTGWWETHASFARFAVDITDVGSEDLDETTIFVSIPRAVDVSYYDGEGWECWDVDEGGNYGIECHNGHIVVPGEAWPRLDIGVDVHDHMRSPGSIGVDVTTGDYEPAHEGIPFKTDTSL
jgi:hypothetical protein